MLNVPKKANDAMHLSLLEGCDISIDKLGEVILQDTFQVRDFWLIIKNISNEVILSGVGSTAVDSQRKRASSLLVRVVPAFQQRSQGLKWKSQIHLQAQTHGNYQ